jgi:hypothetical protein
MEFWSKSQLGLQEEALYSYNLTLKLVQVTFVAA